MNIKFSIFAITALSTSIMAVSLGTITNAGLSTPSNLQIKEQKIIGQKTTNIDLGGLKTSQSVTNAGLIQHQDNRVTALGGHVVRNEHKIQNNDQRLTNHKQRLDDNLNQISNIKHRPDQIKSGTVSGSDLTLTEVNKYTGKGYQEKKTTVDMSNLTTDQSTKNANDIANINPSNGKDGTNGADGKNGQDGKNGKDFNSATYRAELNDYSNQLDDTFQYTADSAAGNIAAAAIDFGTVAKGETEVGFGIGVSSGTYGDGSVQGYAGAAGLKHGLTDVDSGVIKVWGTTNSNYAAGAAIVHKF